MLDWGNFCNRMIFSSSLRKATSMQFILSFFLFLFSAGLLAQDQPQPESVIYSSQLQPGELLTFSNKAIRFKEVVSDSRCPKEVTCVWAGEAKVLVELFENGNFLEEKIITVSRGGIPLNFSAKEILYSIQGLMLLPYPSTKKVDPDYSLEVKIIEKII